MDGGLSAAGSIVSLVAIAGQLIQSTKSLYEFWSSVKEIPTRLQWLREDLKVIQGIIEQISVQSSSARGTTVACHALQNCAIHLNNLKVLVAPLQRRSTKSRKKEIWKSVKAAFNAEKIKLYRENLEAAKLTLVLAQNSLTQLVVTPFVECS